MKKTIKKQDQINKDVILSFLRSNKALLKKKYGVTKIALFGSYARGEETKKSDIDILIEMKVHDFFTRMRLKEFLEEKFGKKVDALYFSGVRKFIMRHIEEDLVYA